MSKRKTQEEYIKELEIKNPTVKLTGEYVNYHTPVMHHCEIHDVYWKTTPSNVLKAVDVKNVVEKRSVMHCENQKLTILENYH